MELLPKYVAQKLDCEVGVAGLSWQKAEPDQIKDSGAARLVSNTGSV